jgi:hypothetical protein
MLKHVNGLNETQRVAKHFPFVAVNKLYAHLPDWMNVLSFPFMGAVGAAVCVTNSAGRQRPRTQNAADDKE